MNPQDQSPQAVQNPLAVMQPDERIICEIKRHPIGIVGIFIGAGLLLVVLAALALVIVPSFVTPQNHHQVVGYGALAFLVFAVLVVGFTFVSHIVYWGNRWIVTSDSITQVTQSSLFNKQSSQLSLAHLEDITVEQNGVFTHIFNYGVVRAETAGERSKFTFLYCPNPNFYAQKILEAREQFELAHHGGKQEPYQTQAPATPANYTSSPTSSPTDPV